MVCAENTLYSYLIWQWPLKKATTTVKSPRKTKNGFPKELSSSVAPCQKCHTSYWVNSKCENVDVNKYLRLYIHHGCYHGGCATFLFNHSDFWANHPPLLLACRWWLNAECMTYAAIVCQRIYIICLLNPCALNVKSRCPVCTVLLS